MDTPPDDVVVTMAAASDGGGRRCVGVAWVVAWPATAALAPCRWLLYQPLTPED